MAKKVQDYPELKQAIGLTLSQLRLSRNLMKSKMVSATKLHRNSYMALEKGESNFVIDNLMKVLDFHQITIFEFFDMVKDNMGHVGSDPAEK